MDLLMWIPKPDTTPGPNALRPLQLPTCFRRLYGAVVAGVLGPIIEPQLCADQAAVAGGHCGPNIRDAFAHLARHRPAPGWMLGQFRTLDFSDGRIIEDGALWDSTGRLVAQARQLALVRQAERKS